MARTCLTSSECSSKSGSAQGNCAAGFGVCCICKPFKYFYSCLNIFSVSVSVYASASIISENLTYIVNPSYPSNYVPSSTPATLTYTVNKCSSDICRIRSVIMYYLPQCAHLVLRLDYDLFVLTAPLTAATTQGQCSTDYMTVSIT